MLLVMILCSCQEQEDMMSGNVYESNSMEMSAVYEGVWEVGNYNAGQAQLTVFSTGFMLSTVPYEAIMRMALPHSNVTCSQTDGHVVPYENIGVSQQIDYLRMDTQSWEAAATINGDIYNVVLRFPTALASADDAPYATYSKVSGKYSLVFPLQRIEMRDGDNNIAQTQEADLLITFVTTRKIK